MHIRFFPVQAISTFFSLSLLLTLPAAAYADSFSLFDVNLVLANGGTITGTVNLDEIAHRTPYSFADLSYELNGNVEARFTGNSNGGFESLTAPYFTPVVFGSDALTYYYSSIYSIAIYLPTSSNGSFAGYTGGDVCSTSNGCEDGRHFGFDANSNLYGPGGQTISNVVSGDLTPASTAVTPEPSSLVLFGTGVLGMAGVLRRRCLRA